MNKYLDAAGIALRAIWGAKLRSLMTVLGNIVAVMSIIAVVSLIQGLNASVRQAILNEAGADSFIVQQFGIVRSDDEWLRVQSNPRITRQDADAVKRYSALVSAVMLSSQARARVSYRDASIDGIEVTGVTPEYVNFSSYDAERGRLISPTEIAVDRRATVIGAQLAERLFGPDVDPIDKVIQIQGLHFRVVGVSARRGQALGQTMDEFAVIPLGQFQQMFGSRRQLSMSVKPRDFEQIKATIDDTTLAMRIARRLKPTQEDNFAIFNSDTVLGLYQDGDRRHLRRSRRGGRPVARCRRHRHHEHHADGRDRAHARNWTAQGTGGETIGHHDADPHGICRVVYLRRHRRDDSGRADRNWHFPAHPGSSGRSTLVRCPGHRHYRPGRPVLRAVSGNTRRPARPHRGLTQGMKTNRDRASVSGAGGPRDQT